MNHKIATENINIINSLLKEWGNSNHISELDYDLLTDKIKNLYEMVKFAKSEPTQTPIITHKEENNTLNNIIPKNTSEITSLVNNNDVVVDNKAKQIQIIGEVMCSSNETIADRLQSTPINDITTTIGAEKITSLRTAIGLNDKYIIVRDLFAGDMDAFEVAIMHLDEFTTIEDAVLFIHDNYGWSRENETARMISDMLQRKLI